MKKGSFDLNDLNNIDLKTIGSAPMPARILVLVIMAAALLGVGYWFDTKGQIENLRQTEAREIQLRQQFETKQRRAANLDAYKAQLEEMRRSFGTMLRQLPSQTEIPNLLVDISQTGLSSGLEIDLFRPENEIRRGFYAEKPIRLRMKGNYDQVATFTSGVASLPRIVTLHDINLRPEQGTNQLTIEATAKTYRYLEGSDG
ncbi:type 4a pilus biogenesis protein PilO [Ectothiorhodospira lacustris]|uniref:type 4a pilus biogenesis protein PilO n=1 Tax=Ectothiorhodospira lacustris TaxID=2899127 RepID=UPI001EE9376E|nr:type 4a pilus biogenesis protein PilO [Ectothiorhodospira lacustris]MCG5501887.1 type 4a pilus biogenesis protein PilO [Ectothiorhodospira lacustris]MCG5509830.1 type 4a pilus biogenesis protein PilO [Ectothiorhodospira lacustris]MCG5521083.1 type 4a pilus biogenesis protein PilO [Ectothiorhodospira lacustris]